VAKTELKNGTPLGAQAVGGDGVTDAACDEVVQPEKMIHLG